MHPRRCVFLFLAVCLPPLGLGLRHLSSSHGGGFLDYAPDVLWALLVYCLTVVLWPRSQLPRSGALALAIAWLVEVGQLWREPGLVAFRATKIGGLLLGTTFLWSDLGCYLVGIVLGVLLDWGLTRGHLISRIATGERKRPESLSSVPDDSTGRPVNWSPLKTRSETCESGPLFFRGRSKE